MLSRPKRSEYKTASNNDGSIPELMKELWQLAVNLRGSTSIRDLFIVALSRQLDRVGWLSSTFSYVGRASLIVLLFQVPIPDFRGQKVLTITGNVNFSYWLSFVVGVAGPLLINALFIRPNSIVRDWFGGPALEEKQETRVSVVNACVL